MSNTDERLSDLLAERARQGSGVHPTREGVGIAVARRAARRRRKRAVGTGLAGLCSGRRRGRRPRPRRGR